MDNRVTMRLGTADAEAIKAIARALRTDSHQFITRTDALRFALAAVAKDPSRFVMETR
jgi:hypothetical protein